MQKRKFDEIVSYCNKKVSEMEIETKYKMELLGMVTALGYAHEKETHEERTETHACDLISRQAAIDFINAGHLVNPNEPRWSDNEVVNFLKSRPPAQSEIVRCKDCKWYELPSHKITENCVRWMKSNGILLPIKPDDFCSYAERREE